MNEEAEQNLQTFQQPEQQQEYNPFIKEPLDKPDQLFETTSLNLLVNIPQTETAIDPSILFLVRTMQEQQQLQQQQMQLQMKQHREDMNLLISTIVD